MGGLRAPGAPGTTAPGTRVAAAPGVATASETRSATTPARGTTAAKTRGTTTPKARGTEKRPETLRLGKVLEFMRLLWALDHSLHVLSRRMESRLGVTAPQRFVLRLVGRFPDRAAGHIANMLSIHPSTLTGVLKRLEQRELLVRLEDAGDRRRTLLRLTEKGRKLDAQRGPGTIESAVRRALGRFEEAELEVARRVLIAIAEELDRE